MTLIIVGHHAVQRSLVPRDDKARNKMVAGSLKIEEKAKRLYELQTD
jgi:hypothetical protein